MIVRITKPARADIQSIFEHLATAAGYSKARQIIAEIRERCDGLSRLPERHQRLAGFEEQGLRRRVYRDWLIVYRIRSNHVEIIRILHGASDIERILESRK